MANTTVEPVARQAMQWSRGTLVAKVDIKATYRLVPIHAEDHPLLGVQWEGPLYMDAMLLLNLLFAPKIFNAVANALQCMLQQQGLEDLDHYLDDFVMWGKPATQQCHQAFTRTKQLCSHLRVPLEVHKTVVPTTCLTFLGITIDTAANKLRLPAEKLAKLKTLFSEWVDRKACSRRELESLLGSLNHACKMV